MMQLKKNQLILRSQEPSNYLLKNSILIIKNNPFIQGSSYLNIYVYPIIVFEVFKFHKMSLSCVPTDLLNNLIIVQTIIPQKLNLKKNHVCPRRIESFFNGRKYKVCHVGSEPRRILLPNIIPKVYI